MRRRVFSKFKWAEEFCQDLTHYRLPWQMTVEFNVAHLEDDEIYTYDDFIVDWIPKEKDES